MLTGAHRCARPEDLCRFPWVMLSESPGSRLTSVEATRDEIRQEREADGTLRGLDWLNFLLADVQNGLGPFLAIYLAGLKWNEQAVGLALTVGGVAGIVAQTPAGQLVDHMRSKRGLIAWALIVLTAGVLVVALLPLFWPVIIAQAVVGVANSVFIPAICAISLGLVGPKGFDARQGRNQMFNSAGNVAVSILAGLLGYYISNRAVFVGIACLSIPTLLALRAIQPERIDFELARGGNREDGGEKSARFRDLLSNRPLLIFLVSSVLFHFANAAMLPLRGEMLAKGKGRTSMFFMAACIVTTQATIAVLASWAGRKASSWGRKPLLLIGFAVLPVRGVLYTLTANPVLLVAIQILDGIGSGLFGVVSVLVIADLTRGTGRFKLTVGAITAAGSIVVHFGYRCGFHFLLAVAVAAAALLWRCMPETRSLEQRV